MAVVKAAYGADVTIKEVLEFYNPTQDDPNSPCMLKR
jgi:hypothetical protein